MCTIMLLPFALFQVSVPPHGLPHMHERARFCHDPDGPRHSSGVMVAHLALLSTETRPCCYGRLRCTSPTSPLHPAASQRPHGTCAQPP